MNKPILVIMAAGMGSRYGGLKQIDPVDDQGHVIIDYSIYDAKQAGFDQVVFVIRKDHEQLFREAIGNRVSKTMKVHYAFQSLDDLPEGFEVPEGRTKPWGTGQAVLAARKYIHGPFAVINADDYYGRSAFRLIYQALEEGQGEASGQASGPETYTMVGYRLRNTLTDNGSVARGVCTVDGDHKLQTIVELTRIIRKGEDAAFTEDDGKTWTDLCGDSTVSMNLWGFPLSFLGHLKDAFPAFLTRALKENPQKGEFFLPFVVNDLMGDGTASVNVLQSEDVWHGVTYQPDKQEVVEAMKALRDAGAYPEKF